MLEMGFIFSGSHTHTETHTDTYMYLCVYISVEWNISYSGKEHQSIRFIPARTITTSSARSYIAFHCAIISALYRYNFNICIIG